MVLEDGKALNLMKIEILPISGDASFRTFYRLIINKKNKIIVLAHNEKYKNLIAYTAINRFLRNNKILTPKLYNHNFSQGIIIIQDFAYLISLLPHTNIIKIQKMSL